jgi:DNA polymerase-3 subunit beta
MQFFCDQSDFYEKLTTVSKAVSNKSTHPILKGVFICTNEKEVILKASDMEISIYSTFEASIKEEGSIVIPAKKIVESVKFLPKGEISFSCDENNRITLVGGKTKYTLLGIDPNEFPEVFSDIQGETIEIESDIFASMINKTNFAASTDESRGIITGSHISIENNFINIVALDGFRIAVVREPIKTEVSKKIIVHARILREMGKIVQEEGNLAKITISEKQAFVEVGRTKIYCRLMVGDFIKYEDLFPKENNISAVIDVDDLKLSLERTGPIVSEGKSIFIRMDIENDSLLVSSKSTDGDMQDSINVIKTGEDISIGFNHRFLYEIIKNISVDRINFEINTAVSPCIIRPVNSNEFEYLILPVRIGK